MVGIKGVIESNAHLHRATYTWNPEKKTPQKNPDPWHSFINVIIEKYVNSPKSLIKIHIMTDIMYIKAILNIIRPIRDND